MKEFRCGYYPECLKTFKSEAKYNNHLVFSHEAYQEGTIKEATINSLNKVMDRVSLILIKFPEARNIHDWMLYVKYIQVWGFQHILIYDVNLKGWTINKEDNILTAENLKSLFGEQSTVSRCRRKLQELDRNNYHSNSYAVEHICILPSEKSQEEAIIREKAYRGYFSKG